MKVKAFVTLLNHLCQGWMSHPRIVLVGVMVMGFAATAAIYPSCARLSSVSELVHGECSQRSNRLAKDGSCG